MVFRLNRRDQIMQSNLLSGPGREVNLVTGWNFQSWLHRLQGEILPLNPRSPQPCQQHRVNEG